MFKRLRQLEISLAAKCQLLFGAAVVLIIAAALAVPLQRMEQLTDQLNERSARMLTDYAVADHVAHAKQGIVLSAPDVAVVKPTTTRPASQEPVFTTPRLILAHQNQDDAALTSFEKKALRRLRNQDGGWIASTYEAADGSKGYRYVRIDSSCVRCHAGDAGDLDAAAASSDPKHTSSLPLVGMISADIPSQIDTNQLLLNRAFMLSAGLLAGALAIVVFYLITTRLILQPVRVLQETAQKVSEGDLNIRSDINTGDEFQQLSETFNQMLANLKNGADQLRAANKSLDLRLGQLAEANSALYESNRLKSEFLANVSHELRTPLNSILGFADLLKEVSGPDPKVNRYVQNILTSGHNLLDLINDLLDLAKIEAGRMEVRSEPLSLGDLFEGLVNLLKPLTEGKSLSIIARAPADLPVIHTDPAKLQQVLYNFLSNAIKFSPPGAKIDLGAELDISDGVRIWVTDRGPGIPREQHGLIFEKFRQIDASVTRQHSGTGLGLAISRELTLLLGGEIGLRSEAGAGSTFWVVLPLKNEAGTEDLRGKVPAGAAEG